MVDDFLVMEHPTPSSAAPDDETPQPQYLAKVVDARILALGLNKLAASKLGIVSRSTLNGLANRVPTATTLTNLDTLLSWQPGSAQAVLYGGEPTPREEQTGSPHRPRFDIDADNDYGNLTRWITKRISELKYNKVQFAKVSGVGRSTLATIGRRGYTPTARTLENLDTHLLWEPGSALAALKGGTPIPRGPDRNPHPSLIPITAIKERLRVHSARLIRQRETIDRALDDVAAMQRHIDLLYTESQEYPPRDA